MITKTAVISSCEQYRYRLGRVWSHEPLALFAMLNPSDGDDIIDDPTLVRCMNYAKDWGYGGIDVVNLFAYRTKKPKILFAARRNLGVDIIGPDNSTHISNALAMAGIVIAAWGANARRESERVREFKGQASMMGRDLYCLATTEVWGEPRHPLMLKVGLQPKIWTKAR